MDSIYPKIYNQSAYSEEASVVLDAISFNKNNLIGHSNLKMRIKELVDTLAKEIHGPNSVANVEFTKPNSYPNTYVSTANYTASAKISMYNALGQEVWNRSLIFPVAVGSLMCKTYGKTDLSNLYNGERWKEVGGYFAFNSGMEDIIRTSEKKQTLIPLSSVNKTVYSEEIRKFTKKNENGPLVRRGAGDQDVQRFITTIYVYDVFFRTHMLSVFMYEGILNMSYNFAKNNSLSFSGVSTNLFVFFLVLMHSSNFSFTHLSRGEVVDKFYSILNTMMSPKIMSHLRILANDAEKQFKDDKSNYGDTILGSLRNYKANDMSLRDTTKILEIRESEEAEEVLYRKMAMISVPLITFISDRLKVATNGRIDTDIDNYGTKMYVPSHELLFSMIREQLLKEVTKNKNSKIVVNPKNSSIRNNDSSTSKLIQKMDRETYYSVLAKMRTIMVNSSQHVSSRAREVRLDSQMGCIDPFYTPESDKVGLRKEMAIFAWISLYRRKSLVFKILQRMPSDPVNSSKLPGILFVNGVPHSRITEETYLQVKSTCKRDIDLFDIVFTRIHGHYSCNTIGGTIGHFVFTTTNKKLNIEQYRSMPKPPVNNAPYFSADFVGLLTSGVIEFLAANEVGKSSIAIDASKYAGEDYAEIDPISFLSFTALSVPFSNKTFGVRLAYQSNMVQQSFCAQPGSMDAKNVSQGYLLSGQPAICNTETGQLIESHCSAGSNIMVGFTMQAYNSEDSFVCSESCTKTLLRYAKFKRLPIRLKIQANTEIDIAGIIPGGEASSYKHIDPRTGLPILNSHIYPGDTIFAKYRSTTENGVVVYKDTSIRADVDHCGVITTVALYQGFIKAGIKLASNYSFDVIFGNYRHYIAGDKICARYAQKQTCGQIVPDVTLPIISSGPSAGTRVEMLMSPAMFPSRQTSALISEIVSTTYGAYFGEYINSTPFRDCDIKRMKHILEDVRRYEYKDLPDAEFYQACSQLEIDPAYQIYDESGQVQVSIGGKLVRFKATPAEFEFSQTIQTAEKPEFLKSLATFKNENPTEEERTDYELVVGGRQSKMMVGLVRVNLLRHQARDKIKVSTTNPAAVQGTRFRQTRSGRDGGLRYNKQENNATLAGGAPTSTNERHVFLADGVSTMYCSVCGLRNTKDTTETLCSSCGGQCYMCQSTFGSIIFEQAILQAGMLYECRSEPI